MRPALLALLILAAVPAAWAAKIELSTVPPREGVEVIIYRDVDLTLVREQRTIRFHKGENEVAFSWADTAIDPTSVRIRIAGDGAGYALTQTTYPPEQPNTLVWHITAPKDGPAPLEVSYFTSGLTWAASYILTLSYDETEAVLAADFSISNGSGETYDKAKVALLTGGVQLVEQVVALGTEVAGERSEALAMVPVPPAAATAPAFRRSARGATAGGMGGGMGGGGFGGVSGGAAADAGVAERKVEIAAGNVSEHERYDLDTELGLLDGWVTRLRFAESSTVKPEVLARIGLFSDGTCTRVAKIKNDKEHGLGKSPLPAGPVSIYKRDKAGRLLYIGNSNFPYAAVGQEVEVIGGALQDIVVKPRVMAERKRDVTFDGASGLVSGKVLEDDYFVEVNNRDAIPRKMELLQPRPGVPNRVVGAEGAEREADLLRWKFEVTADGGATLKYQIHQYFGLAVNNMPKEGE